MHNSLLTLHFQLGLPPWSRWFLTDSAVTWAKLMDPGDDEPHPEFQDINWVIRFNEDENTAKAEVLRRKQGAYERLLRIGPALRKRPWLSQARFYLEHMNEPSNAGLLKGSEGRISLDVFTAEFTRILYDQYGVQSCGYCLGVGHPEPQHVGELFKCGLPALLKHGGIWALHEYGYPTVISYDENGDLETHYTLRHRRILKALRSIGMKDLPKLHITEAGIDRLLTGVVGGWKQINNDPRVYVDQLRHYDYEVQARPLVEAIYVFTATPEQTWWSYGIEEADAEVLAHYIRTGEIRS